MITGNKDLEIKNLGLRPRFFISVFISCNHSGIGLYSIPISSLAILVKYILAKKKKKEMVMENEPFTETYEKTPYVPAGNRTRYLQETRLMIYHLASGTGE